MNILYIDVETTGLDKTKHGIICLAYIIDDSKGSELTRGKIEMNPLSYTKEVSRKALDINGYTIEQLRGFKDAKEACKEFIDILHTYYGGDKYKIVAYNADFDTQFIQHWINKLMPNTYWKLIDYKHLDPFALIKYLQFLGKIDTGKSQTLSSVAEYFSISLNAHNAESAINATKELHKILITEYIK